jgi:hypothetical protein
VLTSLLSVLGRHRAAARRVAQFLLLALALHDVLNDTHDPTRLVGLGLTALAFVAALIEVLARTGSLTRGSRRRRAAALAAAPAILAGFAVAMAGWEARGPELGGIDVTGAAVMLAELPPLVLLSDWRLWPPGRFPVATLLTPLALAPIVLATLVNPRYGWSAPLLAVSATALLSSARLGGRHPRLAQPTGWSSVAIGGGTIAGVIAVELAAAALERHVSFPAFVAIAAAASLVGCAIYELATSAARGRRG